METNQLGFPETNNKNRVYDDFFRQRLDLLRNIEIVKTPWRNKESNNSYCYKVPPQTKNIELNKKNVCDTLCAVFNITNREFFKSKFNQVVAGDGQELKRINVLHSSSLIALLCFYNVTEDNPLRWNINGNDLCFTKSKFEKKNYVAEGHNSNIDVVLEGYYANNKQQKVVLFLESKFSEYFSCGAYKGISKKAYKDVYDALNGKLDLIKIKEDDDTFTLYSERPVHYCGGIKQMISHYQGIVNGILSGKNDKDIYPEYDIYLAEILFAFSFDQEQGGKGKLEDYEELYKTLAIELNDLQKGNPRFNIAPKSFTYQDIFANSNKEYKLDEQVKKLYFAKD